MIVSAEGGSNAGLSTLQIPSFTPSSRTRPIFEGGVGEEISTKTALSKQISAPANKNDDFTLPRGEAPSETGSLNIYNNRIVKRYPYENIVHMFTEVSNFMRVEWEQNNITQIRNRDLEIHLKNTQETLQLTFSEKCRSEAESVFIKERMNDITKW